MDLLDSSTVYSVDDLIGTISKVFPETRITIDDWYAWRHTEEEDTIMFLRAQGYPMENADQILLASIDRLAEYKGLTKGIVIQTSENETLFGHVSRYRVMLSAELPIQKQSIDPLLTAFRSLGIVREVSASDLPLRIKNFPGRSIESKASSVQLYSDEYHRRYSTAVKRLWPFLLLAGRPKPDSSSSESKKEIEAGMAELKAAMLVADDKALWSVYWLLGKAYEAIHDFENFYQFSRLAFLKNPNHVDVLRELAAACLRINRISEAVQAARMARDLAPQDAGVLANLARVLLSAGEIDDALAVGRMALGIDPDDSVTRALVAKIQAAKTAKDRLRDDEE